MMVAKRRKTRRVAGHFMVVGVLRLVDDAEACCVVLCLGGVWGWWCCGVGKCWPKEKVERFLNWLSGPGHKQGLCVQRRLWVPMGKAQGTPPRW